jgi:hypothetical protein
MTIVGAVLARDAWRGNECRLLLVSRVDVVATKRIVRVHHLPEIGRQVATVEGEEQK